MSGSSVWAPRKLDDRPTRHMQPIPPLRIMNKSITIIMAKHASGKIHPQVDQCISRHHGYGGGGTWSAANTDATQTSSRQIQTDQGVFHNAQRACPE